MEIGAITCVGAMMSPVIAPPIQNTNTTGCGMQPLNTDTFPTYSVSLNPLEVSRLESDLFKAALLIALLDNDEKEKEINPFLDLMVALAAVKLYEQIQALNTSSAVGFIGNGAGGSIGISINVMA